MNALRQKTRLILISVHGGALICFWLVPTDSNQSETISVHFCFKGAAFYMCLKSFQSGTSRNNRKIPAEKWTLKRQYAACDSAPSQSSEFQMAVSRA